MEKITILIPVYNEVNTLDKILEKVEKANFCRVTKRNYFNRWLFNRRNKRSIFKIPIQSSVPRI